MGYLPIFLEVGGRQCVVIGGGELAEAKVRALIGAGAIVTVVSPEAGDGIKLQAASGKLRHLARRYESGDLRGNSLAYVVVDDPGVVCSAVGEAKELGIPLNVADNAEASSFISPATFKRGDLQIAISTGGSSPAVARIMRQRLEREIGPEYATVLEIMRRARQFLRGREADAGARALALTALARALLDAVGRLDYRLIDEALRLHLGSGMAELGLDAPDDSKRTGAPSLPS